MNCNIGIGCFCNIFEKFIDKNSELPLHEYINLTTILDDQDTINVQIYQGERVLSKYCDFVGDFRIDNIPKGKAGQISIKLLLPSKRGNVIIPLLVVKIKKL